MNEEISIKGKDKAVLKFLKRIKDSEEKKPVDWVARLIALACLLAILGLLAYVVMNVQTLTTSPCELCEKLGAYCVPDMRVY